MKHTTISLLAGLIFVIACRQSTTHAQRAVAITGARIETAGEAGTIENGTLLVGDGKIEAIGTDVEIPVSAKIIRAAGKTITPGIVDPYFVVPISRSSQPSTTRTIVFQGRTFIIGGGQAPIATDFAKVADGFDASKVDWNPALRSGITAYHLVTAGYAQSMLAQLSPDEINIVKPEGFLHVTATNSTKSLDVLRNGFKGQAGGGPSRGRPTPGQLAAIRSGGRGPASASGSPPSRSSATSSASDPAAALWSDVKAGKTPLFVNVDNASAILHVDAIAKESPKARVALVASGENILLALEELNSKNYTLILAPDIDLVPNSQNRVNLPKTLKDQEIDFLFSLSLGQSNFRNQQNTPLFAVAMLVRSGLDRTAALEALTIGPAKLLGIEKDVGSLEVGKRANLIVFDGDPFAITTGIEQVYVEGKPIDEN